MFREKNRLGMFITSINSCIINSNFQVVVVHQKSLMDMLSYCAVLLIEHTVFLVLVFRKSHSNYLVCIDSDSLMIRYNGI